MNRKVFIGWDVREEAAYEVAAESIRRHASRHVDIIPLRYDRMQEAGYIWHNRTEMDLIQDEVSSSTDFGKTRFLIPHLQQDGLALFIDCDMVIMDDVHKLFQIGRLWPSFAVHCVKHQYEPVETTKMDGQPQRAYPRKNWSSVMLWNCAHPAHHRLSLHLINTWPRRFLHRFCWLEDQDIGSLPAEWNWLVGVQPKPAAPKIAHFTLGGKWLPNWPGAEHDEIWEEAHQQYLQGQT